MLQFDQKNLIFEPILPILNLFTSFLNQKIEQFYIILFKKLNF
jgi:hypothetical protein